MQTGMDESRRGAHVTVRAYNGKIITRRIWQEDEQAVYILDEENYRKRSAGVVSLMPVGFSRADIICIGDEAQPC